MPTTPYLGTADVKAELPFAADAFGIDDSADTADVDGNTDWDRFLADIIAEETDRLEGYTGTVFEPTGISETLSGDDSRNDARDLPLGNIPVRNVTAVTVDGTALAAEDYYVDETHLEHLGDGWPGGRRNIVVDYQYGHDELPGPLRDGLIRLVRSRLEQRKSDGLQSESGSSTSYTYRPSKEIRDEVRATAQQHSPASYTYHIGASLI